MENQCNVWMGLTIMAIFVVLVTLARWWPTGALWVWGILLVVLVYQSWYTRAKAKERRDLFDAMTPKGPSNDY